MPQLLRVGASFSQHARALFHASAQRSAWSLNARFLSSSVPNRELFAVELPSRQQGDATTAQAQAQTQAHETHSPDVRHMPIRAMHLARKLDIGQLFQKLYTDRFKVQHYLMQDSLVLWLRGEAIADDGESERLAELSHDASRAKEATDKTTLLRLPGELASRRAADKWVVYFDYGAVVFFNCEAQLTSKLIKHATRFCRDLFKVRGHDEELLLVANPAMSAWSQLAENNIYVQFVDHNNVHVIAGVLAQTVALEHYERQTESILSEFEKLNAGVQRRGPRHALLGLRPRDLKAEKQQHYKLYQIVATNNALLIDVVSKLRVLDRKRPGDDAWTHANVHQMWETMVEEFELHERFDNLNFKLELIQHNTKFFLEVLGTHKGERLEWYIIVLIAVELLVSLYDMAMKMREKQAVETAAALAADRVMRDASSESDD